MKLAVTQTGVADLVRRIVGRAEAVAPPLPDHPPFDRTARRVRRASVPRVPRRRTGTIQGGLR
ncbi:MAG: hypothetical protein AAF321_08315 [Pseudomonadota bacterium]